MAQFVNNNDVKYFIDGGWNIHSKKFVVDLTKVENNTSTFYKMLLEESELADMIHELSKIKLSKRKSVSESSLALKDAIDKTIEILGTRIVANTMF